MTGNLEGIYPNIPSDAYHARELGVVSKSALDAIHRSPAHYKAWVEGALEKDTTALTFGKTFHCALLEPDRFAKTYAFQPDFGDMRYAVNKAKQAAWNADYAGKTPVTPEEWETIRGMLVSIQNHPLASRMIRNGKPELTALWHDAETGLPSKCRADYYVEKHAMLVDVKTTEDAGAERFRKSIANYGYHRQAALYREGFTTLNRPAEHFVFIAVEKTAPYAVGIYELDAEGLASGLRSVRQDIATLAECVRTGNYPGYPASIQTLSLPPWAA